MKTTAITWCVLAIGALAPIGCSKACIPGATQQCVCTGAASGAQSCMGDGAGWSPCNCETAGGGGASRGASGSPQQAAPNGDHDLIESAKVQIATVGGIIEAHEARNGEFPANLRALTEGPRARLKEANLTDPWKRDWTYSTAGDSFSLCSNGPDGRAQTDDDVCYGGK